jgi:hypothetical protein
LTKKKKQIHLRVDPIRIDQLPKNEQPARIKTPKSLDKVKKKKIKQIENLQITKKQKDISHGKIEPKHDTVKYNDIGNKNKIFKYFNNKISNIKSTKIFTNKVVTFITALFIIISFIGGMSVTGLLQSSQNIVTSGLIVQPSPPPSPTPPPPEPKIDIGIYSNKECTQMISRIEWGIIEIGNSTTNTIYIKNLGETSIILSYMTENWEPARISEHIELTWNYDGITLDPNTNTEITLTLNVKTTIRDIGGFNFDIIIVGSAN